MASSTDNSAEVDLITCSICCENFKTPKYFPCLHSFCEGCINTYITTTFVKTKSGVDCPVCRMFVSKPGDVSLDEWSTKLPTNHMLLSLIDMNELKSGKKLCTACARENETESACSWCINCAETLCKSCERYHRKHKFSTTHKLVNIESAETSGLPLHHVDIPCTEHPDERVEAYCSDHSVICCMSCVMLKHRKCENVGAIEDAAEQKKNSKEIQTFGDDLKYLQKSLDALVQDRAQNLQNFDKDIQNIKSDVDTLFTQLSDLLIQVKSDIMSEISKTEKEVRPKIEDKRVEIKCKISAIENDLALFQTNMKYAPPAQFLQAMEKLMVQKLYITKFVKDQSQELKEIRVTFDVNKRLLEMKNDLHEFGKLNIRRTANGDLRQSAGTNVNILSVVPTLSYKIGIQSPVTGIAISDNGQVVLSKLQSKTIELRDPRCSSVLSSLSLPGYPWGIKMTSDTEGAVAVNGHGLVLFKIHNNQITKIKEINTNVNYDFVYHQGKYYVGFGNKIAVYDSNHRNIRDISVSHNVYYLAVRDDTSLCYTVWRKRELYCITMDGTLLFMYSHDNLQGTEGVTIDHAGYIYVCGEDSKNVHQLTRDGKLHRIIFDNLPASPYCVSLNKRGDNAMLGCCWYIVLYDLRKRKRSPTRPCGKANSKSRSHTPM